MAEVAQTPAMEFRGINKWFGRVHVVRDLDLQILEGEFFSLLGPSGCGKTTSLRMMAGLEEPDTGRVLLRGADVTNVPPNRRNVNMVFQNYELFPHMTVFDNVAYGLKLRKVAPPEIKRRVMEMLGVVRVEGLEARGARQLSGGQQQRVALARALVNQPAALLLDEPLSALDVKLRKQMQLELKAIQHQLGTTFVYVTHDQEEALLMSDRIGIMNQGVILQVGSPHEIYARPADPFVADFVGSLNVLDLRVDEVSRGLVTMRLEGGGRVSVALDDVTVGDALRYGIRPERVELLRPGDVVARDRTSLSASVIDTDFVGASTQYRLVAPPFGELVTHDVNRSASALATVGDQVILSWDPDAGFRLE